MSRSDTIVLVEDDEGHARLFTKQLRRHGVHNSIRHFSTGAQAVAWIDVRTTPADAPTLFVLDINLPDMLGTEVLACLAVHRYARRTPVVMLTSSDDHADMRRCLDLGCRHFLIKPLEMHRFVEACADLACALTLDPDASPVAMRTHDPAGSPNGRKPRP